MQQNISIHVFLVRRFKEIQAEANTILTSFGLNCRSTVLIWDESFLNLGFQIYLDETFLYLS